MRWYLDTSSAAKLLVDEPEANALVAFLERVVAGGAAVGSSRACAVWGSGSRFRRSTSRWCWSGWTC